MAIERPELEVQRGNHNDFEKVSLFIGLEYKKEGNHDEQHIHCESGYKQEEDKKPAPFDMSTFNSVRNRRIWHESGLNAHQVRALYLPSWIA